MFLHFPLVLMESNAWTQFVRFWSFQDRAVQTAALGVLLLAISSGTLGCFIVLRRMSLLGDSLGHAVLPGVCIGYLVQLRKDPWWIVSGALVSAFLASWLIGFIRRHTRLKSDAVMGLVLSGFYGVGTMLLTWIQRIPAGNQSGLNGFLFGQASAISERDLYVMGALSLVIVGLVMALFKELVLASFDEGFASTIGVPVRTLHYLLMGLTAIAVVIAIQAVGLVLVSAMLITPAATALLATDRMRSVVILSVLFGVFSGMVGLSVSFLNSHYPTGPFVVLTLALVFAGMYLFSPRYGVASRAIRRRRQSQRTQRENVLKSIYHSLAGCANAVKINELATLRQETPAEIRSTFSMLMRRGWAQLEGDQARLTDAGLRRAQELDRNYRLWEQFLTDEINLPIDHTQRDAENIEHILGPELVRELEARFEQRHD
ncbi:MAG: metal ABC transporter permease [Planctomycetes bacterium]|nr:metal ABC transporter permease [Planctomycetota bacterium]